VASLIVMAVRKASAWTLSLSDIPNMRMPSVKEPVRVGPGHWVAKLGAGQCSYAA
jgi:hypothetical protein